MDMARPRTLARSAVVRTRIRNVVAVVAATLTACAPISTPPSTGIAPARGNAPPALAAIDTAAIRRDLFALADDAMRGREAGTLDELRASAWVAEQARAAGLAPAGDDGTYFQFWPMRRIRVSDASRVALDRSPLALWREAAVVAPADSTLDLPIVWVGDATGDALARMDVRGKAVGALLRPVASPPPVGMSLRGWRYARQAVTERSAELARAGAAAAVLVADDSTDSVFAAVAVPMRRGLYMLDTARGARPPARLPAVWVPAALRARVARARRLALDLRTESFTYPSVNVVARVAGSDPAVRGEYVLFSAHQDHDGIRFPVAGDSIWNGADMIGRNSPDSAALLGAQPPHRNSTALAAMALAANERFTRFAIDSTWDRPSHPEFWYFRSDHLPYARAGIPALFFSTLPEPDYHTPRDEPGRIDLSKLARMARWMYATGWLAANAAARPMADDPRFRLER